MVCNAVRRNASAFVSVADESRWTLILVAAQIRGKKRMLQSARLRVRRKARKKSAKIRLYLRFTASTHRVVPIRVEAKSIKNEYAKLE